MLTITLSELMSDVQVTQMKPDGTLEESGEARRLRNSLEEMADEAKSADLLRECGLPKNALAAIPEKFTENRWSWSEVKHLSYSLVLALDASLEHALLVSFKQFFWAFLLNGLWSSQAQDLLPRSWVLGTFLLFVSLPNKFVISYFSRTVGFIIVLVRSPSL